MKIYFVNNLYQFGGAETVVQQLHQACLDRGYQSTLYISQAKKYPADVKLLCPYVFNRLLYTRFARLAEFLFPYDFYRNYRFAKLAKSNADIIHIHNFHGNYAQISTLAKLAKTKTLVWTFHGFWGITGGCHHPLDCLEYQNSCHVCPLQLQKTIEQWQLKKKLLSTLPLHVICPSRHLAKTLKNSPIGKNWRIYHIPNGTRPNSCNKNNVAVRTALAVAPKTTTILLIMRNFQDPSKGFALAKKALDGINNNHIQVLLVGEGSLWAKSQLSHKFSCCDFGYIASCEKLAKIYQITDILLFSSPGENFPCVVLEAMAASCCVVSTPLAGVKEQIEDGVSGLLASDMSPQSLAYALTKAIENQKKRQEYGKNARKKIVENFSEEKMILAHIDLYQKLMAKK